MPDATPLQTLLNTLPQVGRVEWIGVRPARGEPVVEVERVQVRCGTGLEGDRFNGRLESKRQVTLIQHEHLPAIASLVHRESISPAQLRRNLVISGINLLALKGRAFRVGAAVLEYSGTCEPCSKMERELGAGGYNAMRGHGGITARVLEEGLVRIGDEVEVVSADESR